MTPKGQGKWLRRQLPKRVKDMTAEERRAYHAEWRTKNHEKATAQRHAREAAMTPKEKAAQLARLKIYRAGRRERTAELARAWRAAYPEKAAAIAKKYRMKNLDEIRKKGRERAKQTRRQRIEIIRANNKRYKARKRGATEHESVSLQILAERDNWRCHICGRRVTKKNWSMDHLVPLSKGGSHTYVNVSLAHGVCNKRRWAGVTPAQLRLLG